MFINYKYENIFVVFSVIVLIFIGRLPYTNTLSLLTLEIQFALKFTNILIYNKKYLTY